MKKIEAVFIPQSSKDPYSDIFMEIADMMADSVKERLKNGSISLIEAIGEVSMASMVTRIANGQIDGVAAYGFLKSLAIYKTSAPVQKSENRTYLDVQNSLKEIVSQTPEEIDIAMRRAEDGRKMVMDRHKTDNILRLKPKPIDNAEYKEPDEIQKIRAGNE
jgi:hypothetical protein